MAGLWSRRGGGRVEKACFVRVGGYYGDFVAVARGEVRIYEDEDVGEGGGEREGRGEVCPGVGICVEDDCEERWWWP